MNAGLIARRYATVLCDYAEEHKAAAQVYADAGLLLEAIASKPAIMQFLKSPLKKNSEKKSMLTSVFANVVSKPTMQFIDFTVDKERIGMIDEILRVFKSLYKKRLGIKTIDITTANTLSDAKRTEMTATLEKKLKSKVEMSFRAEKEIIGGVIIDIDGRRLDCSVKHQLDEIEKKLTV